jgi:hypothetical protein
MVNLSLLISLSLPRLAGNESKAHPRITWHINSTLADTARKLGITEERVEGMLETTQLEGGRIGVLGVLANERAIRAWCKRVQASGLHYFDRFLTTLERWIMGSSM